MADTSDNKEGDKPVVETTLQAPQILVSDEQNKRKDSGKLKVPVVTERKPSISIQDKRAQNALKSMEVLSNNTNSSGVLPQSFSMGSVTSNHSVHRQLTPRELTESTLIKIMHSKWAILSLAYNTFLLAICFKMNTGFTIAVDSSFSSSFGCIAFEMMFIVATFATQEALNDGASAFFGYQICSRKGLSAAVCGFYFEHPLNKTLFANSLLLSSKVKKQLTWLSVLWVLLYLFEWVLPLTPIGIEAEGLRTNAGAVPCVVYGQDYAPYERLMPTVVYESGVSEVIFGSSLGILRSEVPGVNITTAVIAPQIIGAVSDGDTILGKGFTIDISTTCTCQHLTAASDLVSAQHMLLADATNLYNAYSTLNNAFGIASRVYSSSTEITIITALAGTPLCGGVNGTTTLAPVCNTTMQNHYFAEIMVSYMTDGTPASIAAKSVGIISTTDAADISTWASTAITNVLGGVVSASSLPNLVPGVMNPLFWWTTPNLIAIDFALLDAGIETMFAILFRGSVQRTYSAKGTSCTSNVHHVGYSVVTFNGSFFWVAVFCLCIQLAISLIAVIAFLPWILSERPVGPGVRLIRDKSYCITVITQSSLLDDAVDLSNAPSASVWQLLDVDVRLGESLNTVGDPDYGTMILDVPRRVLPFKNGKNYS